MHLHLAQTHSLKGNLAHNKAKHLALIQQAAQQGANLIAFPELSLSNYEPTLANSLAIPLEDPLLDDFQAYSDNYQMVILVGVPLRVEAGVQIGMVCFQPQQPRSSYAKQLLHEDEQPYFVAGDSPFYLNWKREKIGLGICYESLQPSQLQAAAEAGVTLYIASVAKSQQGVEKAYQYFPKQAAKYGLPIAFVNNVEACDNFVGAGQSAFWNAQGELLQQLGKTEAGLLSVVINNSNTNRVM